MSMWIVASNVVKAKCLDQGAMACLLVFMVLVIKLLVIKLLSLMLLVFMLLMLLALAYSCLVLS